METKPKLRTCPTCSSPEVDWYERGSVAMHFTQDASGIDPIGYGGNPTPEKVTGECRDCGHTWTARGACQIWDLPGHPEYQEGA